jgi:acetyltransferase-like isoleucine patch superfamily enzyme
MLHKRIRRRARYEVTCLKGIWWRLRFRWSCWWQSIDLVMGARVRLYHPVRVFGEGGRIIIEDEVEFAFPGGASWLGPVGIELRAPEAELRIGRGTTIMRGSRLICFRAITIGPECAISDTCLILDSNAHDWSPGNFHKPDPGLPVILGSRVHTGPDVTILKGVTIGDDTTVSTRSVVLSSVPARCVAMGNPARVRHRYPPSDPAGETPEPPVA